MSSVVSRITIACCLILGFPSVSLATPLTYADILTATGSFDHSATTGQNVTAGTGQVIADFNDNGIAASGNLSSVISAWIDDFTVIGGTGTDSMMVAWSLDGTLTDCSNCQIFAAPGVTLSSLYGQTSVFSLGTSIATVSTPGGVSLNGTLNIPFTYGVTFSGGLRLTGSTGDTGAALGVPITSFVPASFNFLQTATITSLVLPEGASLRTGSGTLYPLGATPVPEPGSIILTALGLTSLVARRQRNLRK
jgi:hypothetical protein